MQVHGEPQVLEARLPEPPDVAVELCDAHLRGLLGRLFQDLRRTEALVVVLILGRGGASVGIVPPDPEEKPRTPVFKPEGLAGLDYLDEGAAFEPVDVDVPIGVAVRQIVLYPYNGAVVGPEPQHAVFHERWRLRSSSRSAHS